VGLDFAVQLLMREQGALPPVLVFLNNDVRVKPGFLDAAASAILRRKAGAAGGPVRFPGKEGRLWYAGGSIRWQTGTVVQQRSEAAARRAKEVRFIPGAAMAVDSRAYLDIGGFDPRFFLYNEDLDLCLRLSRAGYSLVFEPGMESVHDLGVASGSSQESPLYLELSARTRLLPFRSLAYRAHVAAIHTPYVALRAAAVLMRWNRKGGWERAAALLRGHAWALAHLTERRGRTEKEKSCT